MSFGRVLDGSDLLHGNNAPLLPSLDRGWIGVTKEACELPDATEFADDEIGRRFHGGDVRYQRTVVNVDNVLTYGSCAAMRRDTPTVEKLKALRVRSGLAVRELASLMGYRTGSGYQTLEKEDRGDKPYTLQTVRRLAHHLIGRGDPPITIEDVADLLGGQPIAFETPQQQAALYHLLGVEMPADIKSQVSVIPAPVYLMPVVGSVQASFWMSTAPSIDVPTEHLAIPFVPDIPVADQYALLVVGPSMNRIVQEGSYVICQRYGGSPRRAKHGAIVHVERHRFGEVEWTLKRVKYDRDGAFLWPESNHPDFQYPLPLLEGDNDGSIQLLGIAVGAYTRFPVLR